MSNRPSASPLTLLAYSGQANSICIHATPLPSVELCEYVSQPLSLIKEDTRATLLKLWNRLSLKQNKDANILSNSNFGIWIRLIEQVCLDEIENSKTIMQLEKEEQIYFDTLKFIELGITSKEATLNALTADTGNSLTAYHLTISLYRNNLSDSYGFCASKTLLETMAPKMRSNLDFSGFIKTACLNRPGSAQSLRSIIDRATSPRGFCGIPLVNPLALKELSNKDFTSDLNGLPNYSRVGEVAGDSNVSPKKSFCSLDFLGDTPSNLLYRQLTKHATQGMRLVADTTPFSLLNQPLYRQMYSNANASKSITNFYSSNHRYPNTFSAASITSPEPNPYYLFEQTEKSVANGQNVNIKSGKRRRVDCRCCKNFCGCCGDYISEGAFTLSDSEDVEGYNMENPQSQSCKSMLENLKAGKLANGQVAMSKSELTQILTRDGFDFLKPAFLSKIINLL